MGTAEIARLITSCYLLGALEEVVDRSRPVRAKPFTFWRAWRTMDVRHALQKLVAARVQSAGSLCYALAQGEAVRPRISGCGRRRWPG